MSTLFSKLLWSAILSISLIVTVDAQEWESAKENEDVMAYTKVREGGIKEVKVITEVNASMSKLIKFITDYDNPREWKHSTRLSKIVEKRSDDNFEVYFVIATPWPLKDRDFYADVTVAVSDEMDRCEIVFTPNTEHEKHGSKVRMTKFDTKWVLTKLSDNKTKVELYSFGDPVGVPTSFVNMFIVDTPFKTVKNLRKDIATYL